MPELRPYQHQAVEDMLLAYAAGYNPLVVSPTGSGKTVIATAMIDRIHESRPVRVLWVTHRRELIHQAVDALKQLRMSVSTVDDPDYTSFVQVMSVQGLASRWAEGRGIKREHSIFIPELIFIDEAHHASAASYGRLFTLGVPVIGLTATPFRLDGNPLEMFNQIIQTTTAGELCDAGYLAEPLVYSHSQPDLSNVGLVAGEFHRGDLERAATRGGLVGDIVATWRRIANHRRTLVYAVSVDHAKRILDEFRKAGVRADHVDAGCPRDERDTIFRRLRDGEIEVVTNVEIATEGFDLPALDCVVIARPTASLALHLQIIGRAMRVSPDGTRPIILDHSGNYHRHGDHRRPLVYSLTGNVRTRPTVEPLGLRTCKQCFMMYPITLGVCPGCGTMHIPKPRATLKHDESENLAPWEDRSFEYRESVWNVIYQAQQDIEETGYWSVRKYSDRFGEIPLLMRGKLMNPDTMDKKQKRKLYDYWINEIGMSNVQALKLYDKYFHCQPWWLAEGYKVWQKRRGIRR